MADVVSTQQFVGLLHKSNLLTAEQVNQVRARAAGEPDDNPQAFAKRLVQERMVTRWQSKELLAGRHAFFLGQYKLLDKLGIGGRGVVYQAQHASFGRIVALKVLAKEFLSKPEAVARFRREVQVAAALNHPNIVAAFDANCVGKVHFLVMEYVDGKDLSQWLQQHGPLPLEWACECIRQAAMGLQHAHEHGMVHRDIKPGNLMVIGKDFSMMPVVKLLDMGFARFIDEDPNAIRITQPGQVFGTPDYMSPEQAENTFNVDIRSDIFSLGCTMYRMVTAKMPFPGNTPMQKLLARTTGIAPLLRGERKDASEGLEAVLNRMLARNAEDRFQVPGEVAAAIEPFAMRPAHLGQGSSVMAPAASALRPATASVPPLTNRNYIPTPVVSQEASAGTLARAIEKEQSTQQNDMPSPLPLPPLASRGNAATATAPAVRAVAPPVARAEPPVAVPVAPSFAAPVVAAPAVTVAPVAEPHVVAVAAPVGAPAHQGVPAAGEAVEPAAFPDLSATSAAVAKPAAVPILPLVQILASGTLVGVVIGMGLGMLVAGVLQGVLGEFPVAVVGDFMALGGSLGALARYGYEQQRLANIAMATKSREFPQ